MPHQTHAGHTRDVRGISRQPCERLIMLDMGVPDVLMGMSSIRLPHKFVTSISMGA
jgi:hypothetical protein